MHIISGVLPASKSDRDRAYTCLFGVEAYPVLHIRSGRYSDRYLLDECNGGPDGRAFLLAKEDEPGTIYETFLHRDGRTSCCTCPAFTCRGLTCKHVLTLRDMVAGGHLDESVDRANLLAGAPDLSEWPPELEPDFAAAFGAN